MYLIVLINKMSFDFSLNKAYWTEANYFGL